MESCIRHPGVAALARCPACHAPYCAACRVEALAEERAYCSEACRARGAVAGQAPAEDAALAEGYHHPIRMGLALWRRELPALLKHVAPLSLAMAALFALTEAKATGPAPLLGMLATGVLGAYGAALVAVLLSSAHTGHAPAPPLRHAAQRLVPWGVVLAIVGALSLVGSLALLIPGMIVGIRLFWADEYALIHGRGPLEACRESWRLTRGYAGPVLGFQFLAGLAGYLVVLPAMLVYLAIELGLGRLGADTPGLALARRSLVFLLGYLSWAALHAPELVYFYGLRARRAQEPAPGHEYESPRDSASRRSG